MDSYKQHHRQFQAIKHLKFLRLLYLNPCLKLCPTSKLNKNPHSSLCKSLYSNLCNSLYSNLCKNLHRNLHSNLRRNLYSNLCSNLRSSLCSSPDLQTASLISSNSYPFLYKHLISFRRFSIKGDSKTPVVPKV